MIAGVIKAKSCVCVDKIAEGSKEIYSLKGGISDDDLGMLRRHIPRSWLSESAASSRVETLVSIVDGLEGYERLILTILD